MEEIVLKYQHNHPKFAIDYCFEHLDSLGDVLINLINNDKQKITYVLSQYHNFNANSANEMVQRTVRWWLDHHSGKDKELDSSALYVLSELAGEEEKVKNYVLQGLRYELSSNHTIPLSWFIQTVGIQEVVAMNGLTASILKDDVTTFETLVPLHEWFDESDIIGLTTSFPRRSIIEHLQEKYNQSDIEHVLDNADNKLFDFVLNSYGLKLTEALAPYLIYNAINKGNLHKLQCLIKYEVKDVNPSVLLNYAINSESIDIVSLVVDRFDIQEKGILSKSMSLVYVSQLLQLGVIDFDIDHIDQEIERHTKFFNSHANIFWVTELPYSKINYIIDTFETCNLIYLAKKGLFPNIKDMITSIWIRNASYTDYKLLAEAFPAMFEEVVRTTPLTVTRDSSLAKRQCLLEYNDLRGL